MARRPKLKVFRMPIGFHDAYVAAPSRKAAIEAWGADKDVFRRGAAEIVDEPKLTTAPLARPGEVVKVLRGTAAEQLAALDRDASPAGRPARAQAKKPARPKPRPSRKALDSAEAALAAAEARHAKESGALAEREAELKRERKALAAKQAKELERLEARRAGAETAYEEKLRRWRG